MTFTRYKYLEDHMLEIHQIEKSTSSLDESKPKNPYNCPLCSKTFEFQSLLVRHIAAHDRNKCTHCDLGFVTVKLLEQHVAQKHTEFAPSLVEERENHCCELCGKYFEFRSALKTHLAAHKHKCTYCDKLFTRTTYVDDHIRDEHPTEWSALPNESVENRCQHCDKVFPYPSILKTHLTSHKYKCKFCEKIFTRLPNVDVHIKEEHPTEWSCLPVKTTTENRCTMCDQVFEYPSGLKFHMTMHKHKCKFCMKKFTRISLLDEHTKEEHPDKWVDVDSSDKKLKKFNCHLCKRVFDFPSALKLHLAAHKYNCLHCDNNYTKLLALNEHVKEEHPDEWAKNPEADINPENRCDLCDKVFEWPSALKAHMAWHNKHKCSFCDATFPRLTMVDDHIKTDHPQFSKSETAVKAENRCHLCDKVFAFPSVLKVHMAQHNKHKCEHCDAGFLRWDLLREHIKTDHPENSGAVEDNVQTNCCSMCDKTFAYPSALKIHIAWHNKQRKCCPHCDLSFGEMALLEQHISEAHNIVIKKEVDDYDEELTIEHQTNEPRVSKRKRFKRRLSIDFE
jgi:KRAB domain-containing zinc finger protein